jgi:hypothetical protein
LLQTPALTTFDSSGDGIKIPSLGKAIQESWKRSSHRKMIILNILLNENLRRKCGVIWI